MINAEDTVINWKTEYDKNEKFKEYVDRYASNRSISVDEALTHLLVHSYYDCIIKGLS